MSLREAHKRQIESIVRFDRERIDEYNLKPSKNLSDNVVSRYPKTLEGADELEAAEYYEEVWDETS